MKLYIVNLEFSQFDREPAFFQRCGWTNNYIFNLTQN